MVAMGAPLQEKWIFQNREKLNPKLCLGVGGFLDYTAKTIRRSPLFLRSLHLEWLWRLFIEPRRMFKRYVIDAIKFSFYIIKYKIHSRGKV
jgi:N-acetylglucosaminyldiphosphoundecaprenol N-acetyl-beta-D-mannosaminyltransferase